MSIKIKSSILKEGKMIPDKYTCKGENISPSLKIKDIPENTKSLVLIMDDPDAPTGTWDHWVIFNIPPKELKIEENTTPQGIVAKNSWNKNNYGGPCPPSGTHRYLFKIYALDKKLDLDKNATKNDILKGTKDHILSKDILITKYKK